MWPFKSKERKITDEQSELLALLREQKQEREAAAERAKRVAEAQAKAEKDAQKKRNKTRENQKRAALVHVRIMAEFLEQHRLCNNEARKAAIWANILARCERANLAGINVSPTQESVNAALNGY